MNDFESVGIKITTSGTEVRTTCPQCSPARKNSKEKCLAVNTHDNCWLCHHCGWSGSLKGKKYRIIKYVESGAFPLGISGYFKDRAIPDETLKREKIGYFCDRNNKLWIKFPYFHNFACVNVKYKSLEKDFRQEKDAKKCLYRLDSIRTSKEKTLVITEGEIDCLSVLVAGFEATSIPDGAPNPETKNFASKFDFLLGAEKILEKFERIVIAGDADPPGQALVKELGRRLGAERCYVVRFPKDCKDPNDVLVKHGPDKLRTLISSAKPFPVQGICGALDSVKDLLVNHQQGISKGEATGWPLLDLIFTVRPGELTVITGMPGSGKSNFVDALCLNLIERLGWRVGMFSPENWPIDRHVQTLLEKFTHRSFFPSRFGQRITEADIWQATKFLDEQIRFIMPKDKTLSVDTVLEYARIVCIQSGIKILVMDPWNEIEHDQKASEREDQYISRSLSKIRGFARRNEVHIFLVAHPTKLRKNDRGEYDPPTMYDISGGAQWRNKADNGLCIHREMGSSLVKVIVQKVRFREIGRTGTMELHFNFDSSYSQKPSLEAVVDKEIQDEF